MTKLIMHYAPGFLVTLRQDPCHGQHITWGGQKIVRHDGCCDKDHLIYKVIHAYPLTKDETAWCQEQCRILT